MRQPWQETVTLEITGACPARCFNRWASSNLSVWHTVRRSEMVYTCQALAIELRELQREAARAQCEIRVLDRRGLPLLLRQLRHRPVLLYGLPLVVLLSLVLQNFVWFIRLEGNRSIPDAKILQALWSDGLRFGAWAPGLDSDQINSKLLNEIPELKWLTVNHSGGLVTVECAERERPEPFLETEGPADLIATRPGLIREIHVINGFAAVAAGDTVKAGDLLISGVMEWTTHVQATRAAGEVYAATLRSSELVCPSQYVEKRYTGRQTRCVTLIFQRIRRKISGNSSIFGTSCDRMIETINWTLPGGYELPVALEVETMREYRLLPAELPARAASEQLNLEAERLTSLALTAGTIESTKTVIQKTKDSYHCRASMNCVELISKTVPAELTREDDDYGEADQRGADRADHQRVRKLR